MKKLILIVTILSSTTLLASNTSKRGLNPDAIRTILTAQLPKMKACYKAELQKVGKGFKFKPILNFVINKNGKTEDINISSGDSDKVNNVSACVRKVLAKTTFPKPAGGKSVKVSQPFNFGKGQK
jgi:hypothetical protein